MSGADLAHGATTAARHCYEKVLESDPKNFATLNNLVETRDASVRAIPCLVLTVRMVLLPGHSERA